MREPTVEAYRSVEDLIQLRQWFYEPETPEQRHRAVLRVNALCSRATKLPHGVTITSLLMSLQLKDKGLDTLESESAMQLGYTAALIRFVNGLLDPFQKSVHAAPLYRLAHQIKLPGFFVELRHWGTHEHMALLELLRDACTQALDWLKVHYWDVLDSPGVQRMENTTIEDQIDEAVKLTKTSLASYKRIRKSNLSMIYKYGDGSETGTKYWKAVKNLKLVDTQLLVRIMVFDDFLIYNSEQKTLQGKGTKFNPLLIKLYRPLLDELGITFKFDLLMAILEAQDSVRPIEWNQLLEWTAFLASDITEYPDQEVWNMIQNDVGESKAQDAKKVFLQEMVLSELKSDAKYVKWLNSLKSWLKGSKLKLLVVAEIANENTKTVSQFALPPSIDDIIAAPTVETTTGEGNTRARKRQKTKHQFLLEPIPDWIPIPMGQC